MSYLQAVVLGLIQGVTELFPVSSLGHSVMLPRLLGWEMNERDPIFLTFLVATHTATALVLFFYFLKDWVLIFRGMWSSLRRRGNPQGDPYARLGWLLVVATIPAGLLGLLFQHALARLFSSPQIVGAMLILNGVLLWCADMMRKNRTAESDLSAAGSDARIARCTWWQAINVGCLQVLALIPGFSRTGSTITGGLLAGLSYEDAARFSFLLATPIIGAASVLKIPELVSRHSEAIYLGPAIAGSLVAGLGAYLSMRFLLKYFETKTLRPFAAYCIAAGGIASVLLLQS